jgi:hypothetical protein
MRSLCLWLLALCLLQGVIAQDEEEDVNLEKVMQEMEEWRETEEEQPTEGAHPVREKVKEVMKNQFEEALGSNPPVGGAKFTKPIGVTFNLLGVRDEKGRYIETVCAFLFLSFFS